MAEKTATQPKAPRKPVGQTRIFTRYVQIGRVVLITYGPDEGKLAVILDVVDANQVLISGPKTGVERQAISLKRLQLTDLVVPMRRNLKQKTLIKAWDESKVQEKWDHSAWGRKLAARKRRSEMNDFDRFKVALAKRTRAKLIKDKKAELTSAKKK